MSTFCEAMNFYAYPVDWIGWIFLASLGLSILLWEILKELRQK